MFFIFSQSAQLNCCCRLSFTAAMASSSRRPELPDVTSSLFQEWVAEASAEFGSNFREEFGHGWVYDKAHIYRGNKVRKDVAAIFSAMWRALE